MALQLKYNARLYKGVTADFTADKDKVFPENTILLNTTTKKLYIADGVTKLSSLTELNNASSDLTDYAKTNDLADYIPKRDWDDASIDVSVKGLFYFDDEGIRIGDGTTQIKNLDIKLPFFVEAEG